jgi:hypothetical protein
MNVPWKRILLDAGTTCGRGPNTSIGEPSLTRSLTTVVTNAQKKTKARRLSTSPKRPLSAPRLATRSRDETRRAQYCPIASVYCEHRRGGHMRPTCFPVSSRSLTACKAALRDAQLGPHGRSPIYPLRSGRSGRPREQVAHTRTVEALPTRWDGRSRTRCPRRCALRATVTSIPNLCLSSASICEQSNSMWP